MVTDQIADLLTRIRNASSAGHLSVRIPASNSKERVIKVLIDEGYLASVERTEDENAKPQLKVQLRYDNRGEPVIREIKRISTPGRRVYVGKEDIPRNRGGLGVLVVSTSLGVMADSEARKQGVGGELVCSVF